MFGEAFPAGAVTPLVLRCCAHALLLTIQQRWTLLLCDESYIGQTQQKLKDRMGQHLNDVKKLITKGIKSDSFASHFTNHCCKRETKPTNDELRRMMKVKIIWQGNAISCMKSFGKLNCSLCSLCARELRFCARFVPSGGMENHKQLQWNLRCMLA
jgi:hypothetical protein